MIVVVVVIFRASVVLLEVDDVEVGTDDFELEDGCADDGDPPSLQL